MRIFIKLSINFCLILTVSCTSNNKDKSSLEQEILKSEYQKQLKNLYFEDQSMRRVISVIQRKCDKDSIFGDIDINRLMFNAVIRKQDSLRSLKLLELIELYGYPNETINTENIPFYMVFNHSPISLHGRIDSVLKSSKISKKEYQAIKWHLDGRKGMPIFIEGMKYYSDKEIFDYFN